MNLQERIKDIIKTLNEKGLPMPFLRDPATQLPSVTLTMMVISFVVAVVSLIGKISISLKGIDTQQAIYLLLVTSGLYLGRRVTTKDGSTVESKEEKK